MALVINGQQVDDAVLGSEFASIKAYFESLGNVSCCERDPEFRGYARENVIARVLLTQEALRALDPVPEAEIDAAIEELKTQHGGEAKFLAAFGASAADWPRIRQDLEVELRVRKLVDQQAATDTPISDEDLRRYYQSNLPAFMTAEEVRASHILKAPNRGEDRSQSYDLLRDLRRQLREGTDFDALARQHSDKGDEHIDLGFFKRGELAEEFEIVAFSMEVGEISPVFASPFGYHVIKLTDRKPAAPKPFDEVREQALQRLTEERRQERTKELVRALQERAVIEDLEPAPALAQPLV